MLLSRPDILTAIEGGRLRFQPPLDPSRVDQVSVDLLLGRRFTRLKEPPGWVTSIRIDPSIWQSSDIWDHQELDAYVLQPGRFVLAQTLETITLPNDLAGFIEGRSSYARLGIGVHVTAPKIDPGFKGTITLEVLNHGSFPVELRAGVDKPAQLMLLKVTQPLEAGEVYGSGAGDAFQYQTEPIPRGTGPTSK